MDRFSFLIFGNKLRDLRISEPALGDLQRMEIAGADLGSPRHILDSRVAEEEFYFRACGNRHRSLGLGAQLVLEPRRPGLLVFDRVGSPYPDDGRSGHDEVHNADGE